MYTRQNERWETKLAGLKELGELAKQSSQVAEDSQERGDVTLTSEWQPSTGEQVWELEVLLPASGCKSYLGHDTDVEALIQRAVRHFAPALKRLAESE